MTNAMTQRSKDAMKVGRVVPSSVRSAMFIASDKRYESGRGQPHSKTLRKEQRAEKRG